MLAIYPVCLRVLLVLAISLGAAGSSRGDVAVPRHQSAPNDELALAILRDCFEERKAPDIKVLDSAEAFLVEANDALPLAVAARRIEGKRVIVATQSELRLQAKARGRSIYYLRIEIATRTKSRVTIRRLA